MSNLLDKASIVTTPTAYDNGKILSVKPNTSVGDFDFTRNSSATRVNSQGLIEDVQILSSNLVSNGDFSQEGSEQVTNGDFATDLSGWLVTDGAAGIEITWTANGVSFITDGAGGGIQQSVMTVGKSYLIEFDYTAVSGAIKMLPYFTDISETKRYSGYFVATTANIAFYRNLAGTEGIIDNVSVKEVGQDWTLGTGWSIGASVATVDNTVNANLDQFISGFSGKKVKVSFEISDLSSGGILVGDIVNPGAYNATSNGIHTFDYTATNSTFRVRAYGNPCSITNISVVEITDDTNLPRIDYTGGEGHWLFEPQSTNLIPYSEDFSNSYYAKSSVTLTSGFLAPDGSNNAYKVEGTIGSSYLGNLTANTHLRSIYVRTVSGTGQIKLIGSVDLFDVTEQWTRVSYNPQASTYQFAVDFRGGTNISEVLIWGMQVEQQSYATSYIPTNGSTVTRLQDAAFGAGSSDLINSTEGVLYAEIATLQAAAGTQVLGLSDGSGSNRIGFQTSTAANQLRFVVDSGGNQASYWHVLSDITNFNKVALKWKQDDFSFWVNGVKVATDISGNVPAQNILNTLDFYYASGSGIYNFFGKTKCVAVFKEALTDAELTCLTTI